MEINVVIQANDTLGEGPVWSEDEQSLYWVDIQRRLLQRWDYVTGEKSNIQLPTEIGSFAFRESGGFVVALRTGLALLCDKTGHLKPLIDLEAALEFTRFNDGKCDRQGRFWAGTIDEEFPNKRAALYRLDPDGSCKKIRQNVGVSNGLGWSPDNKIFYYTDSITHSIYAYDFDPKTGNITAERIFAQTPDTYVPDGLTVDSDGFIWSAKWDGWKVVRYAPDGKIDIEFDLPVQRPTSCTFGGPGLNLLFITSASIDLNKEEMDNQPLAGSVFVIETDARGMIEPKYSG